MLPKLLVNGLFLNKSYKTMGYYNLSKKYSNTVGQALRRFERQDRNWFREQNFPLIHKIIFGLSRKPLADELLQNPGAVLATDARGPHGSSPKSMDSFGRTTILHAVDSRDTEALHIILGAGADPEPQIPKGLFRGNPLTSASLNGLPGMVNLLIEFGADIDAANPEGLTALHSAAISQNPECASILLAHSADMDQASSNGYTPIMTTIMQNSHAVLRVLLNKRTGSLDSSQLFSIVVEHADSETMSILASSQFFKPSGDCLPADRTILSCRKDYNDALSHAFENLVSVSAAHYC
ncbi:ankyrin repeat-containing domain protein [Xylariaceae sp. FL0255]|nr:ankyrin repeat-containing domain protein [Xylariaceae sp. FL0255]